MMGGQDAGTTDGRDNGRRLDEPQGTTHAIIGLT